MHKQRFKIGSSVISRKQGRLLLMILTYTLKTYFNSLNSMLSRTLSVMFKVKQLFTKNYLVLLHIMLFLVHFKSDEVIRSQSLKVWKSYQNNQVTSIKKLLGVPNRFSLNYHITYRAIFKTPATLLHQPNLTLTTGRNMQSYYFFFLHCPLFREGCGGSCSRLSCHTSRSSIISIISLGWSPKQFHSRY